MKKKFIDNSVKFITKYNKTYSEEDIEKLKYGLEGIYLTITKIVVLFTFAIILHIFKEFILLLLLFNVLRFTGFGFHAKKSYQCFIFSTMEFIVLPYIMLNITISNYIYYIISAICIITYLLYAPADTVKRPLPNKKKRKVRKICTVLTGIVYLLLIIIVKNDELSKMLLCSMIIQSIVIIPLTYKIFKQPYRNYLSYDAI